MSDQWVDADGTVRLTGTFVGGGAGPQVLGPFTVDFTDIAADNSSVDLFTPSIGDLILSWWVDPETFTPFDGDTLMGQGTAWTADAATRSTIYNGAGGNGSAGASHSALGQPAHGGDTTAQDAEFSAGLKNRSSRYDSAGNLHCSALFAVTTAGPVQLANVAGSPMTAGSLDLRFLVQPA